MATASLVLLACMWTLHVVAGHTMYYLGKACEGQILEMGCPQGYYMTMTSAIFGRNDLSFCLWDEPELANTTECVWPGALDVVHDLCRDEAYCELTVSVDTFGGDPCPGTSKFLKVEFHCSEPEHSAVACEGRNLQLECTNNTIIHLSSVTYGRLDDQTCSADGASVADTNCTSASAFTILSELCNNKAYCPLSVVDTLLGDPCPGTDKYLQVDYTCSACENIYWEGDTKCDAWADIGECNKNVNWMRSKCRASCWRCHERESCVNTHDNDAQCDNWAGVGDCISPNVNTSSWMMSRCQRACNYCPAYTPTVTPTPLPPTTPYVPDDSHTVTVCEGTVDLISCQADEGLRIYAAFFGRNGNETCFHPSILETDCPSEDHVAGIVAATCQGRQYCHTRADVNVFGDSCPGTYKYLDVQYKCQRCENSVGNDTLCAELAAGGACVDNATYMLDQCFKTCTHCDTSECPNLRGDNQLCDFWAMKKECTKNPGWMTDMCRESCRECTEEIPRNQTTSTTTAPPGPTEPVTMTVCDGGLIDLRCPTARGILLTAAFYGRDDPYLCGGTPDDVTTQCSDPSALVTLQRLCGAVSSCRVALTPALFADPCPWTSKYVTLTYQCVHDSEFTCATPCGEHGRCVGRDTCVCESGYSGIGCSLTSCRDVSDCHGHGTCTGANQCTCDDGWGGPECNSADCSGVSECNGLGSCLRPNECMCHPYRSGANCSVCVTAGPSCLPCLDCVHGACEVTPGAAVSSYMGCYRDDSTDRDLARLAWTDSTQASPLTCMNTCRSLGFTYAALQTGDTCYCGDIYGRHGGALHCTAACSGATTGATCGGHLANSVWRTHEGSCRCDGPNWMGSRCDACSPGYGGDDCLPLTNLTRTHHINAIIVLNKEWKDAYSDMTNPVTKAFVAGVKAKLMVLHQEYSSDVTDIEIQALKRGSVEVRYVVYLSQLSGDELVGRQRTVCAVAEAANASAAFGEGGVRLAGIDAYICDEMSHFCGEFGDIIMPSMDNLTWSCNCSNGHSGSRCEKDAHSNTTLIIIVVVCCVVAALIALLLCCILRSKLRKKEPTTSSSYDAVRFENVSACSTPAMTSHKDHVSSEELVEHAEINGGFTGPI